MRIYIKFHNDEDYRFDFGFSDDLDKFEVTDSTLRIVLKDGQDTIFKKSEWDWKITSDD